MAKVNRRADHQGEHNTAYLKNRARILKTQRICGICGNPVDVSIKDPRNPMAPTIDHIIPIAKGGHPSDFDNLQLAHRWCNRQKADKLIDRRRYKAEEAEEINNDDLPLSRDWSRFRAN